MFFNIKECAMDIIDNIDPEIIVAVGGRYGVFDRSGFHPSPEPTFEEEIRRNPMAAMSNRLARAKKLKSKGCLGMAKQLEEEADKIRCILNIKSKH